MHLIQEIASLDNNGIENLLEILRASKGDPLELPCSDLMSQILSEKSYVRDEMIRNCITDSS